MQEYSVKVLPEDAGIRLDLFLTEFFKRQGLGFSRIFIQNLILKGKVAQPGLKSLKPHYKVKQGEGFRVCVEERVPLSCLKAEDIPLEIVYEDEDLAIINKPPHLVVHPAVGNYEHTLVNALLYCFKSLSDINPDRPGIVHRLDKETSGLLVIAKNNLTHLALTRQFAQHTIKRKYIALVKGRLEFDEGVIDLPIARHPFKRKNMAVGFGNSSKFAKTYYRTLKRAEHYSLVELAPFTGRTHQLRVHLAFLGHPILGDSKYGKNNEFKRLALHAKSLGFTHPRTGKFVEFVSDTPVEFRGIPE